MIISIKLMKPVEININEYEKFMLNDIKMSLKEVPFVRYAFTTYPDNALNYIKNVIALYKYSAHLIEVKVEPGYIETIERIREAVPNAAIFVYLDIDDNNVISNELNHIQRELLMEMKNYILVDRLMLKDRSNTLHAVSASKIKDDVAKTSGIKLANIGICSSPLSFGCECCLTAERARELATKYTDNIDCALPSANHEGTNTCGCIRYIEVSNNISSPEKAKASGNTRTKTQKENKDSTESIDSSEDKKEKAKKLPKNIMKRW